MSLSSVFVLSFSLCVYVLSNKLLPKKKKKFSEYLRKWSSSRTRSYWPSGKRTDPTHSFWNIQTNKHFQTHTWCIETETPSLEKKYRLLKDSNSLSLGLISSAFSTRPIWSCSGKGSFSLVFWENIAVNYLPLKSFTREAFSKRFVKSCFK